MVNNIEQVRNVVIAFLKNMLEVKSVKVIKIVKAENGWDTKAEVHEESSFIKTLGLPTKVHDRNNYIVKLDKDLQVQSYEKEEEGGGKETEKE